MKNYNIKNIASLIKSSHGTVILFGAGKFGKLVLQALKMLDIRVDYFCDSDKQKQGKLHCGVMTIAPKELASFRSDAHIFITINNATSVISRLKEMNFTNIYNCTELLEHTDFARIDSDMHPLDIQRQIASHKNAYLKADNISSDLLKISSIDIVITEHCSLKCRDCANLMQYYAKPKHCDLGLLFNSVRKFMECIDWLYEFRVLGGEAFLNKELPEIVNELVRYENAKKVVVYTNGTIVPAGEILACLKNNKVIVDITNYGVISKKYDRLIEVLKDNKISYVSKPVSEWTESRIIRNSRRTTSELKRMFMDCCANDTITLLHGKIYRCPFSAHATNLKAIPFNADDIVDLCEDTDIGGLKARIKRFYNDKEYISACYYCNGRDYACAKAAPAVQVKVPLPLDI